MRLSPSQVATPEPRQPRDAASDRAKARVQAEIREEERAETENRARLDEARSVTKSLESNFGGRWKAGMPGSEGRAQYDAQKRKADTQKANHLDFRRVASDLTSCNDAEAITILDREDAKAAAAAAAAAAALQPQSAEEHALKLREAAAKRMRDGIRENMSTLHATFREVDRDNSGKICASELEGMLQRLGLQHSMPQVHDLFRHVGVRATDRELDMVAGTPCRCGGAKAWPCEVCQPKVSISFAMLRTCLTDSTYKPPPPLPLEGADGLTRITAWLEANMTKVGASSTDPNLALMLTPSPAPILTPLPTPAAPPTHQQPSA